VQDYIPSFNRQWDVCESASPDDPTASSIFYESFLTGSSVPISYKTRPAKETMKVKHLMGESSGIGYEQWSDYEMFFGADKLKLGLHYGAASALRRQRDEKGYFSSNQIIGQECTLEEYCDALAGTGVLVCEPGEFSYGLGALVLGRVVEVAYKRLTGKKAPLSAIMKELLWVPLGMSSAEFFLPDGDPRAALLPTLYGGAIEADGKLVARPYEECLPKTSHPLTVPGDQQGGARKCESGDTGACMTVEDYSKFYEMLLAGGVAADGSRLLSVSSVDALLRRRLQGLRSDNPLAAFLGLQGEQSPSPTSFNFGWAVKHGPQDAIATLSLDSAPQQCFWSGYASNHGVLYPEDAAYILIFPQLMGCSPGVLQAGDIIKGPSKKTFLSLWR